MRSISLQVAGKLVLAFLRKACLVVFVVCPEQFLSEETCRVCWSQRALNWLDQVQH